MVELSDAVLVREAQTGHKEAFSLLVSRHWARVGRLLQRIHPAEADDLRQEAFLQAYLRLDELRQPERFSAWVCGIALNLARMSWRSTPQDWLSWEAWETADSHPLPEQVAMQQETAVLLARAIADLPPAERETILLVYGEEWNQQETADWLGISLSAVKVRLHRGRRRLQAALPDITPKSTKEIPMTMIAVTVHDVLWGEAAPQTSLPDELAVAQMGRLQLEATHTLLKGEYQVVLLKEQNGERALCIWIGPAEGMAIASRLKNETRQRPLTAQQSSRDFQIALTTRESSRDFQIALALVLHKKVAAISKSR